MLPSLLRCPNDSTDNEPEDCRTAGFRQGPCPLWVICGRGRRSRAPALVRFAPKADEYAAISVGPLGAKGGHMQRHKIRAYSIISSARIISDSGMSMPSSTSAGIRAISRREP